MPMVRALPYARPMCLRPLLLPLLLCLCLPVIAQNDGTARVKILNADVWQFDEKLAPGAQRLMGNVRFQHEGAIMRCDSAYLFDDQRVLAFGNVHIDQGDTLKLQGDRLEYNGRLRTARLDGNVRLRDKDMELTTPSLDHDLRVDRAVYTEGGTIVSKVDSSTLTSQAGIYHSDSRLFVFSRNVRLVHPERLIVSDTMHYATASGLAEFFGPTTITQDSTVIRTTRGTYDTKAERARFSRRSSIDSKGRLLEGDSLYYVKERGIGWAWGNVVISDTASDMIVRGDHGRYEELRDRSMITGHAELVMLMDDDSLHLHADTLFTRPEDGRPGRRIHARRGVRFYKSDMQGVCDTLVYSEADSTIHMRHRPALWSGTDQITGDEIRILMSDGQPHRLFVERNAFMLSKVDSTHLDQVTGTEMTGYFVEGELHRIIAEGNSRTVYFAREEKEGVEEIIGVNRVDGSRIDVYLADGQVSTISFQERPAATFFPLEKIPADEKLLKGALWRGEERPLDRDSIFLKPEPTPELTSKMKAGER